MLLSNKITLMRVVLAPVFFVIYMLPDYFPDFFANENAFCIANGYAWTVPALWLVFIISELSDMFDGMIARKRNETSDFGKLFDPFADTLMQISCFLCFVLDGIFPAILFLLVLYRELGILLLRNMMMKKGIAMGARLSGKIKTVTYIAASTIALMAVSIQSLGVFEFLFPWFKISSQIIFAVSVILAIVSFFDYLAIYRKTLNPKQTTNH